MKNIITICLLTVLLVGCGAKEETVLTTQKNLVVLPDQSMYQCGDISKFPDSNTLTDIQVASLFAEVYREYVKCHNSLYTIKSFLEKAKVSSEATSE